VVILTSHKDHCDAIILRNPTADPVHVPLPTATLKLLLSQRNWLKVLLGWCNVRDRGQSSSSRLFAQREPFSCKPVHECFADMLNWLWVHVVDPIYQVLKLHGISEGRLWWLPTGAFTGLPLHASPPTDEFIHSYTVALGTLLAAYTKKPKLALKLGVVGVTHDVTHGHVIGVKKEVDMIQSIIAKEQVECLQGVHATVEAMKSQLKKYSWAHIACQGKQDLYSPERSGLILHAETLELETILRMSLPNAQFVFLSASNTAKGNNDLVNESFHLAGGFIAAGFRGAIGTLWNISDSDRPLVAEIFYSHLFRNGRTPDASEAAEALQLAVKELKARHVPYERWVPFVHLGV